MRKTFIKKLVVSALTGALIVGTISASAFAKTRDFYNTSTKKIYTVSTMTDDDFNSFVNDVADNQDNYVYEFNGKYYSYTAILNDYFAKKKTGLTVMQAFTNCLSNTASMQSGFDPSGYTQNTSNSDNTSDFSVISID